VQGCDASVLLDSTPYFQTSEQLTLCPTAFKAVKLELRKKKYLNIFMCILKMKP
jgi:hypothetical protein